MQGNNIPTRQNRIMARCDFRELISFDDFTSASGVEVAYEGINMIWKSNSWDNQSSHEMPKQGLRHPN